MAAEPPVPADHAEKMNRGRELFSKHIRKMLQESCFKCHGGEKTRSGLDLTTREGLLKGGDKGLVVVLGRSKESRLYQFVAHVEEPYMPSKMDKLSDEEIGWLATWIDLGAPYDQPLVTK